MTAAAGPAVLADVIVPMVVGVIVRAAGTVRVRVGDVVGTGMRVVGMGMGMGVSVNASVVMMRALVPGMLAVGVPASMRAGRDGTAA